MAILTFDDIVDAGKREILTSPTRFSPELLNVESSDVSIMLHSAAAMAEEVAAFAQRGLNELSLATAQSAGGELLDRWAHDRYLLARFAQTLSVGACTITRTAGVGPLAIPATSVVGTATGTTFATLTSLSYGAGTSSFSVNCLAQTAGVIGNAAVGAVTQVISSFPGENLSVTNALPFAGGFPRETDNEFAARIRGFFVSARRGTLSAIVNGAISVPQIAFATADENLDADGDPAFRVNLTIADRDGQANQALADLVRAALFEFRALGTPVQIVIGNPQFVDITIEDVQFDAGTVTTTTIDQIRGQILSLVNNIFPNKPLERALLFQAVKNVPGTRLSEQALVLPAGDLFPSSGSVIRTTASRITINGNSGAIG